VTSVAIELPLDEGFLRRRCPACLRQFKWHHGPTEDRPADVSDPELYHCPYCGETANHDSWWTHEQLDYMQEAAAGPIMREVADELGKAFGKPKRSGLFSFSATTNYDEPEDPTTLQEPDDMVAIQPPCHPWEPIKVTEDWYAPLHCPWCGAQFAM
jgi:hypothetical protein